jgi:AcrR family transcriptional regulator
MSIPPDLSVRRKPGPDGESTRRKLIAAALELFGRKGFDGVGAREIAAAAGAPLAAIPYHFGTKDALYRAALEQVRARMGEGLAPAAAVARAALNGPVEAVQDAIDRLQGALLDVIVGDPRAESWAKLLLREHLDPSAAFDLVYEDAAKDAVDLLAALIAKASGRDENDSAVLAEAFARVGEVIVFRVARHAVARRLGVPDLGPAELAAVKHALKWS